jgi:hypothetical protein
MGLQKKQKQVNCEDAKKKEEIGEYGILPYFYILNHNV